MALGAGDDGLDVVRRLISQAGRHLTPGGVLAVEVGHNRHYVESAFPSLPMTWLSTSDGDDRVFLLTREQLQDPDTSYRCVRALVPAANRKLVREFPL